MAMNLTNFRPMKSAAPPQDFDYSTLFADGRTWYASPKVDGIRCVIHPELGPVTNTLKPIRNTFIREALSHPSLRWLDGELIVGSANDPSNWGNVLSGVMSEGGEPDFKFLVFDNFEAGDMCGYGIRKEDAANRIIGYNTRVNTEDEEVNRNAFGRVTILDNVLLEDYFQFQVYESQCVAKGYEGVMLRLPAGKYKKNRSTLREGGMIKVKRYTDAEARVVGWTPLEVNDNQPYIDGLGLQKRTSHKDGKEIDDNRVGSLVCEGINGRFKGVGFSVGSGFDDTLRTNMRDAIELVKDHEFNVPPVNYPIGKILTYKYQDHGSIDAPRQPIFKGFRDPDDIT